MDSPRQQAARSYGWSVGGIVRERLISKAPARANERYHSKQQSQRRRVRVERFRTSFFIYEFICDAGDLRLTRGIIVIVGEKGKCHQALSNKERGDGMKGSDCRGTSSKPRADCKCVYGTAGGTVHAFAIRSKNTVMKWAIKNSTNIHRLRKRLSANLVWR